MADIQAYPFVRHVRGTPTTYIRHARGSRLVREGVAQSFWFRPRSPVLSEAPVDELLSSRLAFDHGRILADGLERARAKLEYTPLATAFVGEDFTVAELRHVYEVVWGKTLDPRNFHRKVTGSPGMLEPTGGRTTRNAGRPAQLYRRGEATLLNPPITRAQASD